MPDIELTRSHTRGLDEGREAVEKVAQQLEADLEVDYQWNGDTLLFEGAGAEGQILVEEDTVEVVINLSAFLKPVQARVEKEAGAYLDRYLHPDEMSG